MRTISVAIIGFLLTIPATFAGELADEVVSEIVVSYRTPADPSEFARLIAASQNMVVPVPAKTPFDGHRGDRRAYLRAYRAGYRFTAATRCMSTCCMMAGTPHSEAIIAGHYDGQLVAASSK